MFNIVTVNFNNSEGLRRTLENVSQIKRNYDFNYLVVDGGSSDDSVSVLNDYKDIVDFSVSERDSGIYNAMNKSLDMVEEGFVLFLNSGDILDLNHVPLLYEEVVSKGAQLIYGDYAIQYGHHLSIKKNGTPKDLWKGRFCHQSMAVEVGLLKKYKFDEELDISADSKFVLSCISEGASIKKIDFPLAVIEPGGVSDIRRVRSVLEQWKLTRQILNISTFRINAYFFSLLLKNILLVSFRYLRWVR